MFGSLGLAVRAQLAILGGFDLMVAVGVLAAAEVTVSTPGGGWPAALLALLAAVVTSSALLVVWSGAANRWLVKGHKRGAAASVFVVSLGLSTVASGLVGLLRGGGLRQAVLDVPGSWILGIGPSVTLCFVGAVFILIILAWWSRSVLGFRANLWAQNKEFAEELGIEGREVAFGGALISGVLTGFAGWYFGVSNGTTPELGLPAFLYGAGSALLLPYRRINMALLGGLCLGALHVGLQFAVAPPIASAMLFGVVFLILLTRGTSRTRQGVR